MGLFDILGAILDSAAGSTSSSLRDLEHKYSNNPEARAKIREKRESVDRTREAISNVRSTFGKRSDDE